MKPSLQKLVAILSQNSWLQSVEMLQREEGQSLCFPVGGALHLLHPEAHVVDKPGPHATFVIEVSAHQVREVDDELLEHCEVRNHGVCDGVTHWVSSCCFEAVYRLLCFDPSRRPFAFACGPPR